MVYSIVNFSSESGLPDPPKGSGIFFVPGIRHPARQPDTGMPFGGVKLRVAGGDTFSATVHFNCGPGERHAQRERHDEH